MGGAVKKLQADTTGFECGCAVLDLGDVVFDNLVLDQREAPRFIESYVSSVVGTVYTHGVGHAERIYGVVEVFANELNDVDTSGSYDDEVTTVFYGAVDGVLASLSASSTFSPTISATYSEVMKTLRSRRYASQSLLLHHV